MGWKKILQSSTITKEREKNDFQQGLALFL